MQFYNMPKDIHQAGVIGLPEIPEQNLLTDPSPM